MFGSQVYLTSKPGSHRGSLRLWKRVWARNQKVFASASCRGPGGHRGGDPVGSRDPLRLSRLCLTEACDPPSAPCVPPDPPMETEHPVASVPQSVWFCIYVGAPGPRRPCPRSGTQVPACLVSFVLQVRQASLLPSLSWPWKLIVFFGYCALHHPSGLNDSPLWVIFSACSLPVTRSLLFSPAVLLSDQGVSQPVYVARFLAQGAR